MINTIDSFSIALSLSLDSFSFAIIYSLIIKENRLKVTLFASFIFAFFQAILPVLGWYLGSNIYKYINNLTKYFVFIILSLVGLKMIYEGFNNKEKEVLILTVKVIILTGIATSIDAFAVGITFFLNHNVIIFEVTAIFIVTLIMCIIGFSIGSLFPKFIKDKSSVPGGIVLIIIAVKELLL